MDNRPHPSARSQALTALHQAGASRWDPVGLRYLQALDQRLHTLQGDVQDIVQQKFTQALAEFSARFAQTQAAAQAQMAITLAHSPLAAKELQRLYAAGQFRRLSQRMAELQPRAAVGSLRQLVQELRAHTSDAITPSGSDTPPRRAPLRALQQRLSQLSVAQQVQKALSQAPANAGPINSHMLMLRSLEWMRELSPAYLENFMTYADTLLCLEQHGMKKPSGPKPRKAST